MKIIVKQSKDFLRGAAEFMEKTDISFKESHSRSFFDGRKADFPYRLPVRRKKGRGCYKNFTGFVMLNRSAGAITAEEVFLSDLKFVDIRKSYAESNHHFLIFSTLAAVLIFALSALLIGGIGVFFGLVIGGAAVMAALIHKIPKIEFSATLHDGRQFIGVADESLFIRIFRDTHPTDGPPPLIRWKYGCPPHFLPPEKPGTAPAMGTQGEKLLQDEKSLVSSELRPPSTPVVPEKKPEEKKPQRDVPLERDPYIEDLIARLEWHRNSAKALVERAVSLPENIRTYIDAIQQTTEKILETMWFDPEDVVPGDRFLSRYLPAAHHIVDECVLLSDRGGDYEDVRALLDKSAIVLERLDEAFRIQLHALMKNNMLNLSVKLETLDKVLKMDGH